MPVALSFPRHNLCEGFNTPLLKSILNPILLERFMGDYKQWWLSWRDVSSGHCLLQHTRFSSVFIFYCLFEHYWWHWHWRALFLPESTFTYTSAQRETSGSFTASRCSRAAAGSEASLRKRDVNGGAVALRHVIKLIMFSWRKWSKFPDK